MEPSEFAVLHVTQSHTITRLQKLNRHLMEVIGQHWPLYRHFSTDKLVGAREILDV